MPLGMPRLELHHQLLVPLLLELLELQILVKQYLVPRPLGQAVVVVNTPLTVLAHSPHLLHAFELKLVMEVELPLIAELTYELISFFAQLTRWLSPLK